MLNPMYLCGFCFLVSFFRGMDINFYSEFIETLLFLPQVIWMALNQLNLLSSFGADSSWELFYLHVSVLG